MADMTPFQRAQEIVNQCSAKGYTIGQIQSDASLCERLGIDPKVVEELKAELEATKAALAVAQKAAAPAASAEPAPAAAAPAATPAAAPAATPAAAPAVASEEKSAEPQTREGHAKRVQEVLKKNGLFEHTVDGVFGKNTRAALAALKKPENVEKLSEEDRGALSASLGALDLKTYNRGNQQAITGALKGLGVEPEQKLAQEQGKPLPPARPKEIDTDVAAGKPAEVDARRPVAHAAGEGAKAPAHGRRRTRQHGETETVTGIPKEFAGKQGNADHMAEGDSNTTKIVGRKSGKVIAGGEDAGHGAAPVRGGKRRARAAYASGGDGLEYTPDGRLKGEGDIKYDMDNPEVAAKNREVRRAQIAQRKKYNGNGSLWDAFRDSITHPEGNPEFMAASIEVRDHKGDYKHISRAAEWHLRKPTKAFPFGRIEETPADMETLPGFKPSSTPGVYRKNYASPVNVAGGGDGTSGPGGGGGPGGCCGSPGGSGR